MTRAHDKLLFLDVDGVLLDYQEAMVEWLKSKGFSIPDDYKSRKDSYYPAGLVSKEEEAALVDEFGRTGGLASLKPHDGIHPGEMSFILNHPSTFVLSTFKESFRPDRYRGIMNAYGAFPAERVLSSFLTSKGQIVKDTCEKLGVPTSSALLVDDVHYNLDSASEAGAKVLLVSHGYNSGDFWKYRQSTSHSNLNACLLAFLMGVPNGS